MENTISMRHYVVFILLHMRIEERVLIIYIDGLLIIQKLGLFNTFLMLCQAFFIVTCFFVDFLSI